jgi:hypothetical protein
MEDKSKVKECCGLEKFSIPLLDEMERRMGVGRHSAFVTKLMIAKAVETAILVFRKMAMVTIW